MEVSIKRRFKESIDHRFVTGIDVDPYTLDHTVVDAVIPTYLADWNDFNNYQSFTISPTLARWSGTSSIPFNKLISISGIDMKRLKENMKKVKEKEITFVSIGYGGLSINVLHFLSLLSYRVGVDELFEHLHVYENDYVSATNMIRFYKDMFKFPVSYEQRVLKLELFEEENLAKEVTMHNYRLEQEYVEATKKYKNVVFFGAPDFETRKILEGENFMFAGHQGDKVILVKTPVVDTMLTRETYGTINLTSFFINMLVLTDGIIDQLANGFDDADDDDIIFEYNSKEVISSTHEKLRDLGNGLGVYRLDDSLNIVI
jgi:hypothetical protein